MNTRLVKPKVRAKKAAAEEETLGELPRDLKMPAGFISPFKRAAEFPVSFSPYRRILE